MPRTTLDITAIKQRLEACDPRPVAVLADCDGCARALSRDGRTSVLALDSDGLAVVDSVADAAFFAAAHADMRALLQEVAHLRTRLALVE